MTLTLKRSEDGNIVWWAVSEIEELKKDKPKISEMPHYDTKAITIYTFNEKNIPKMLQYFSKRG